MARWIGADWRREGKGLVGSWGKKPLVHGKGQWAMGPACLIGLCVWGCGLRASLELEPHISEAWRAMHASDIFLLSAALRHMLLHRHTGSRS
jgi:hypothetical protein